MPRLRPRRSFPAPALFAAALVASAVPLSGQMALDGPVPPLFAEEAPLEIRIESNFRQILRDREEENPEHEGVVVVTHADGTEASWPVQVRTRGRFRLMSRTCDFPPIRLNFPKSAVEGGVFEGQDKVKLVTHCRDRYEPRVVREYVVYRLYNVLTSASFRVRMARVTYVDTSGEEETIERLAFFIEMEESLAERLNGEVIPDEDLDGGLHPARVLNADAVRVNLFEYMVGNTDFSLYGSTGQGLHNIVPVELENGTVLPVPYDFDWTGVVDAPYAEPNRTLGIRSVTDRVYRGLCRPGVDYPALYRSFEARRDDLMAVVVGEPLLPDEDRDELVEYLEDFWETIGDEGRAERRIERACRPV